MKPSKKRSKLEDLPSDQKQVLEHCKSGDVEKLKLLLKKDSSCPTFTDGNGITAIMYAASGGQVGCLHLLLQAALVSFADTKAGDGKTALMHAASKGQLECLQTLLSVGVDKNAQDNSGTTALMKACHRGHLECVRVLLDAGAKTDIVNSKGETAGSLTTDPRILKLLEQPAVERSASEFASMLNAAGLVQELSRLNSSLAASPPSSSSSLSSSPPTRACMSPEPRSSSSLSLQTSSSGPSSSSSSAFLSLPAASSPAAKRMAPPSPTPAASEIPKQFAVMLRAGGLEYVGTVKRT